MTFTQQPLFPPKADWLPTPVGQLPSWEGAKRVGIDTETCDPQLKELGPGVRRGGFVAGISFKIEDGPGHYLPIGHLHGPNLEREKVIKYLQDQAQHFTGAICGLNLPYDLDYLAEMGVWFGNCDFLDAGLAEPLIDDLQFSYGLDAIAKRWGMPPKREQLLDLGANAWGLHPKADMWKMPASYCAEYAVWDAELPLKLLRLQERQIEEQDLWPVWRLETALLPVLVKMRRRGVGVDLERLEELEDSYERQEIEACHEIKRLTGYQLAPENLEDPKAIVAMLMAAGFTEDDTGLTKGRECKKTGERKGQQLRTDADTLARLDHPSIPILHRAKRFHKLRCTFADSIRRFQVNGRIHCSFKQLKGETDFGDNEQGANFGRTSCTGPNLQQQPNPEKDPDIAGEWREIYIADADKLWACCDYSQQEPRWLIDYAERLGLERASEAAQKYRDNPSTDNHQMIADMCGIERKPAKVILLGRMYGMGDGKLCKKLGLPTVWKSFEKGKRTIRYEAAGDEGQAIIDRFNEQLPFVSKLAELCKKRAGVRGYIKTKSGRRCRFPLDDMGRYDYVHKALNRLIQGTSGDQMKQALVDCDAAGLSPQLVVHDEIDCSVTDRAEAEQYAEIMANAYESNVPFKVDVEIGPNWGQVE